MDPQSEPLSASENSEGCAYAGLMIRQKKVQRIDIGRRRIIEINDNVTVSNACPNRWTVRLHTYDKDTARNREVVPADKTSG